MTTPPVGVPIQIAVAGGSEKVLISEFAARILNQFCNQAQLIGSEAKFQLGIAQRELEESLKVLDAGRAATQAAAQAAAPPGPPNRQQRRQLEREAKKQPETALAKADGATPADD